VRSHKFKIHVYFILNFKIMYLNAWGFSVGPKHVAYVDKTNKICCVWEQDVRMSVLVTIVACYSATGMCIPSMVILRGKVSNHSMVCLLVTWWRSEDLLSEIQCRVPRSMPWWSREGSFHWSVVSSVPARDHNCEYWGTFP